jgi:hypothetical protein
MFRTVPLSIIRSFPLYTQQWYTSYSFGDSLRANCLQNCICALLVEIKTTHKMHGTYIKYGNGTLRSEQDRQCTCNVTTGSVRANHCCCRKAVLYSEWLCVTLVIKHAMRMCHAVIIWPASLYNIFPHYLINGMIFEEEKIFDMKYAFRFPLQLLSEEFFILRRTE